MAPKGGTIVDISGMIARVKDGVRYAISGVTPSTWMGPGQPLAPAAPVGTAPRLLDYPVGFNQQTRPRANTAITFQTLRELARTCDILRLVIETRKDQVESMNWQIRPRADSKTSPDDPRIAKIQAFFLSPDKRTDWTGWLRALLEDLFVLDAVAIYKRRDKVGRLYSLDLLNGATIALKLDETGRTPMAPDVAYQQILKGVQAVDFSTDELIYAMRNPRTDSPYGYGPVEQIIATVNIALRRTASQLGYFTDGNLTDGIFWLPPEWTPDQVSSFQKWWDGLHSGNQLEQRKAKFVPGAKDSYQAIQQPPLKDEFDEWIARVVCYAFSIAPTPFIKQMNRATADNAHDSALEEGLAPILRWVKCQMDRIIAEEFDAADLEFGWIDDREIDPDTASQIQDRKLKNGTLLIDEARAQDGNDPLPDGLGATPGIITLQGFVPLPRPDLVNAQHDAQLAGSQAATELANNPPEPVAEGDEGTDGDNGSADPGKPSNDAQKAAGSSLKKKYSDPLATPKAKAAITSIHKRVQGIFDNAAHHVATQLRGFHVLGKADRPDDEQKAKAQKAVDDLNLFDLADMKAISSPLTDVFADAATTKLDGLGVEVNTGLFGQINTQAATWARDHAAALVTQITDTTRDQLRATIAQGYADGLDIKQIADKIEEAAAFSNDRSLLIANTETAIASGEGSLNGFKTARGLGITIKKQWLDDPEACPVCQLNADDGPIDLDDEFSSGDLTVPAHPACRCDVASVIED